jgi:hypothetical protein
MLIFISGFQITAFGEEENMQKLPDSGVNFECRYCHLSKLGGQDLNPFGKNFQDNNMTYDDTLKSMDSDGDGFTNEEEFAAEPITNPGDSESFPDQSIDMVVVLIIIGVIIALVIGFIFILKS